LNIGGYFETSKSAFSPAVREAEAHNTTFVLPQN